MQPAPPRHPRVPLPPRWDRLVVPAGAREASPLSERIKLTAGPGRGRTEHERSATLALAGHPRLAGLIQRRGTRSGRGEGRGDAEHPGDPGPVWGGGRGNLARAGWTLRTPAQDSCPHPAWGQGDPGWERSRELPGRHRTPPWHARHPPPPRQAALSRCPLQAGPWPGFTLPAETGRRWQETLGPRPGSDTVCQPRSLRRDPEQPPSPTATPASPQGCFGGWRTLRSLQHGWGGG